MGDGDGDMDHRILIRVGRIETAASDSGSHIAGTGLAAAGCVTTLIYAVREPHPVVVTGRSSSRRA